MEIIILLWPFGIICSTNDIWQTRVKPGFKKTQDMKFKQATINKCIKKTHYKRSKKEMDFIEVIKSSIPFSVDVFVCAALLLERKEMCVVTPKVKWKRDRAFQKSFHL